MAATSDLKREESSRILRESSITLLQSLFLIVLILSTDLGRYYYLPTWTPVRQGFYCFDENLSKPFYPNTVPTKTLLIVGVVLPAIVVMVTECCCNQSLNSIQKTIIIYEKLTNGLFALVTIGHLTNITKYAVGRLR